MSIEYYGGIDASLTATAVLLLDREGNVVKKDVFGYSLKRDATVREKIERLLSIASGVVKFFSGYDRGTIKIGIEGFAFGARGAQNDLGELHGVIKSQLMLALRIAPCIIAVTSGRKTVFKKGNLPKKQVIPELSRMGYSFKDHNEADAFVVAQHLRITDLSKEDGHGQEEKS